VIGARLHRRGGEVRTRDLRDHVDARPRQRRQRLADQRLVAVPERGVEQLVSELVGPPAHRDAIVVADALGAEA
jgi:hypothetical protein